jgi:hypothetical protein
MMFNLCHGFYQSTQNYYFFYFFIFVLFAFGMEQPFSNVPLPEDGKDLVTNGPPPSIQLNTRGGFIDYTIPQVIERFSIVVKHIPPQLTEATLKEFFEHYGGGPTTEIKYWKEV